MSLVRIGLMCLFALVAFGEAGRAPAADAAAAAPAPELVAPPSYYRPIVVERKTFPVARASWLSLIQFQNDWHEPRFRLSGGRWRLVGVHEGVDIVAEEGTPVLAAAPGTVEAVGWTFYSGNRVGLRGRDGRYYFYAHLSRYAPGVEVGAPMRAGDLVGRVGNTGYGAPGHDDEFPPHLHFGIEGPGGWVNPYPLVVDLYRASVSATGRLERRATRAGLAGDEEAFDRLTGQLYAGLGGQE